MILYRLFLCILILLPACTKKTSPDQPAVVSFLDANIPHLDPIHSVNKYSSTVNSSIFEGLYHYHYLKRPISIEPLLAEALPEISKDGKTYKIKIKKGVFFQDDPAFANGKGRELIAQDFIDSWKRLADPKNKALGWWVLDGLIEGLNEWRNDLRTGKAYQSSKISGLSTPDNYTLVIKLTRPSLQFLHFLAMPVTMVVAKEVVKKYGKRISNHPVGTGPFKLKKWVRNSQVVLVKNKNYRQVFYPQTADSEAEKRGLLQSAGQPLPLSDKVIIKIMRERQPEWLSFITGEIDHGVVPRENYDQVFKNNQLTADFVKKGINYLRLVRPDVTYISFNMEHPILGKNVHLRRAFAHAIDKKLLLQKFYKNLGVIAEGPIPPPIAGYDPNYKSSLEYDLQKARQALIEAGYPAGTSVAASGGARGPRRIAM